LHTTHEARFAPHRPTARKSEARFAVERAFTARSAGTAVAVQGVKRRRAFTPTLYLEPAMHDIDRTQLEYEAEYEYESDQYEYMPQGTSQGEARVFSDADEMELAAELLATNDEQELDQFIGKIIGQAGEVSGKPVKGKTGSKLGGFLKGALGKLLPAAAGIAGGMFGGPLGAKAASSVASAAGKAFGLELEGLSPEDQEFETARRFVRFAGEAAKQAGKVAQVIDDPQAAAKKAMTAAAKKFAPGLLAPVFKSMQSEVAAAAAPRGMADRPGHTGRWIRQGGKVVLLGL
jgi:hypothetical protein